MVYQQAIKNRFWETNNTPINNTAETVHRENFELENFIDMARRHEAECATVVSKGKLLLTISDEFAAEIYQNQRLTIHENMSVQESAELFNLFKRRMRLGTYPNIPNFYNIKNSNGRWYICVITDSTKLAHELISKENRSQLVNAGGIDWMFPSTIATKAMLNKMKRKRLILDWHLSRKSARIVILRVDSSFYTIRNSIEVSGLLTVARNADHLIQITNDPRIYYTSQGLSRRNEIALREILD